MAGPMGRWETAVKSGSFRELYEWFEDAVNSSIKNIFNSLQLTSYIQQHSTKYHHSRATRSKKDQDSPTHLHPVMPSCVNNDIDLWSIGRYGLAKVEGHPETIDGSKWIHSDRHGVMFSVPESGMKPKLLENMISRKLENCEEGESIKPTGEIMIALLRYDLTDEQDGWLMSLEGRK